VEKIDCSPLIGERTQLEFVLSSRVIIWNLAVKRNSKNSVTEEKKKKLNGRNLENVF
jgi:hypothetical protein